MKITNKDTKKAREYAMMYYIEQAKKKNPTFKLTKDYKVEIERYVDGIISAQEFNDWTKTFGQ
jgi:hypothetical protein